MTITKYQNIGDLVAVDYRTASIFKNYNIDFCCNGNRTVETACEQGHLNVNSVLNDLNQVINNPTGTLTDFQNWSIDLLADYIQQKHHKYVERKITEIEPYLVKIASVHGNQHPELHAIKNLFHETAEELTAHMKKEEQILFPFLKKMVRIKRGEEPPQRPSFGKAENPIAMMKHEHDDEGERFRKISALSNNYATPADGCNTYRVAMGLLKEFEEDLHLHIHLENNILFPKALLLEAAIFKN